MENPFVGPLLRASGGDLARLRRAYRGLSLRLHPDSSGREGEEFILAREAYEEAKGIIQAEAEAKAKAEASAKAEAERAAGAFRDPGYPSASPTDLGERPISGRGATPGIERGSEEERAALYYGVAYWKLRSAESRLAFRLAELEAWATEVPEDPFDWVAGYAFLRRGKPGKKPWTIHMKRQRQVVPLLPEDESLCKECQRFEEYIGQRLSGDSYGGEEEARQVAALFLAALRSGFAALRQDGEAEGAERARFEARLEELRSRRIGFMGPHAFRAACIRLAAALGAVVDSGWRVPREGLPRKA
jgi:hypothetical protein